MDALCPASFISSSALFPSPSPCLSSRLYASPPPPLVLFIPSTSFFTSSLHCSLEHGALNVCSHVALDCTFTHVRAHTHTHITDEQSPCDRRLLMTDTRLILSGAKGVKRGPQRGREKPCRGMWASAVLCVVFLSLLHSLPLRSFLSLSSHPPLHHTACL